MMTCHNQQSGNSRRHAGRLLLGALLLCLLFLLPSAAQGQDDAALTLMVYMTGSNLESEAGMASRDLQEMMTALSLSQTPVNVLVMAGGSAAWKNGISSEDTSIYALAGGHMETVAALPKRNMGQPDTLRALLRYGKEAYPASRHALILWDHGGGPMLGVCFDECYSVDSGPDALTLKELDEALKGSPFAADPLEWIGFDACLMATVETAATIAPYARYMIASQETEPATGWDYGFLAALSGRDSAEETGRRIIDAYLDAQADQLSAASLSCVNLRSIASVRDALGALFAKLNQRLTKDTYSGMASFRAEVKSVANASIFAFDLVDLMDLITYYEDALPEDCRALKQALQSAVVYQRSNAEFLNGLSIYYPFYNKEDYVKDWAAQMARISLAPGYDAFISHTVALWLGDALADWEMDRAVDVSDEEARKRLSVSLTPEEAAHFASAEVVILSRTLNGEYAFVYATRDTTLDEGGMLSARYDGEALCAVGANGQPMTGPISYLNANDALLVAALLQRWDMETDAAVTLPVFLVLRQTEDAYAIADITDASGDAVHAGKSIVSLSDWQDLLLVSAGYLPAEDARGALRPHAQWNMGESLTVNRLKVGEEWTLRFLPRYGSDARYAMFEITDTQNNTTASRLIPLDSPNRSVLPAERTLLIDNEQCRVTFVGAEQVSGLDGGIECFFLCENKREEALSISMRALCANATLILDDTNAQRVPASETSEISCYLPLAALQGGRVASIERITLTLGCVDSKEKVLFSSRVSFPLSADTMERDTYQEPLIPTARAQCEGLELTLYSLTFDAQGCVSGIVRIANTGDQDVALGLGSCVLLDGAAYEGRTLGNWFRPTLPAGCNLYGRLSVDPLADGTVAPPESIREITLYIAFSAAETFPVVFSFDTPLTRRSK